MGKQLYLGTDLRIASNITFIPNLTDPTKHHALATAICNRGKSQSGKELRDDISLNFWGKRAVNACHYLYPGKQVNIEGRVQSYNEDLGQVNAQGARKINRRIDIVVTDMQLLGDSMKEMERIFGENVIALKAQGRLPAEFNITAAELLRSNKGKPSEFVAAVASQTGYFGRKTSRVWTKDILFWDQKIGQINIASAAPAGVAGIPTDKAGMAAHIANLQKTMANMADAPAADPTVDPAALEAGAAGEVAADPFA